MIEKPPPKPSPRLKQLLKERLLLRKIRLGHFKKKEVKERSHRASEFLGFGGASGTEGLYMIYTDNQVPGPEDLVVIINPQGKVLCTIDDPAAFIEERKELQARGLLQVLRVSRVSYL